MLVISALHSFTLKDYGYRAVAFTENLDVFYVRSEILQETCSNYQRLPSFDTLSQGFIDIDHHSHCDLGEANRLVHVPTFLQGDEKGAKDKAMEIIREMNARRKAKGAPLFCDIFQEGVAPAP